MRQAYIGTKIINAEPCEKNGMAGYTVYYPDGYASWSPADVFEAAYRLVSNHERQLLAQTDAEASIAAISDGGHEQ